MKKITGRLTLRGETVRVLAKIELERVVGGWQSEEICTTVRGAFPATGVTCPPIAG
jgi:hypothetical protein